MCHGRLAGEINRCSSCNRILYAERGGGNINTDDKEMNDFNAGNT